MKQPLWLRKTRLTEPPDGRNLPVAEVDRRAQIAGYPAAPRASRPVNKDRRGCQGWGWPDGHVVGGLSYSVGAVLNLLHRPALWPGTFGPHELFHLFVLAGSLAHYLFILKVVVPFVRGA